MINNFTSGYRVVNVDIQEYDTEFPVIRDDLYRHLRQDYSPETPLVMKFDGVHFPVVSEFSVPGRSLLVPPRMVEWFDGDFDLKNTESDIVFALKGGHAESFLSIIPNV